MDIKTQAKRLRADLARDGVTITHSRALELTARQHGFESWRALNAAATAPARPGNLHAVHYDLRDQTISLKLFTSEADLDAELLSFYRRWADSCPPHLSREDLDHFRQAITTGNLRDLEDLFSDLTDDDYVHVFRNHPADGLPATPPPEVTVFVHGGRVSSVMTDTDVHVTVLDGDTSYGDTVTVDDESYTVDHPATVNAPAVHRILAQLTNRPPSRFETHMQVLHERLMNRDAFRQGDLELNRQLIGGMVTYLLDAADHNSVDLGDLNEHNWQQVIDQAFADGGELRVTFCDLANPVALLSGPLESPAFTDIRSRYATAAIRLLTDVLHA